MRVDRNFICGNIEVLEIRGNTVTLANELRDTWEERDWFYWAFRVTGAAGKTVTFQFPHKNRVGYWGAAVSTDLYSWEWTGNRKLWTAEDGTPYEAFTYTFGADEDEVYFCYNMLYTPERFARFCAKNSLKIEELCISNKGRSVPMVRVGAGEKRILLSSRHHCCESTGTYVMDSVLQSLIDAPLEGYEIVCVPFVDYDGVVDGDQGKHRLPHDHNRDYPLDGSPSLYNTCAAIRRFADTHPVSCAFDFHSPKHCGDINDKVHIPYSYESEAPRLDRFSEIFQSKITPDAIAYDRTNNWPAGLGWNKTTNATFIRYMINRPSHPFSFTLETPYFGEADGSVVVNRNTMYAFGQCFAAALRDFLKETER